MSQRVIITLSVLSGLLGIILVLGQRTPAPPPPRPPRVTLANMPTPLVLRRLEHGTPRDRAEAQRILIARNDPAAILPLIRLLRAPDPVVTRAAAEVLVGMGGQARDAIIKESEKKDPKARAAVVPPLLLMASRQQDFDEYRALAALLNMGPPGTTALRKALAAPSGAAARRAMASGMDGRLTPAEPGVDFLATTGATGIGILREALSDCEIQPHDGLLRAVCKYVNGTRKQRAWAFAILYDPTDGQYFRLREACKVCDARTRKVLVSVVIEKIRHGEPDETWGKVLFSMGREGQAALMKLAEGADIATREQLVKPLLRLLQDADASTAKRVVRALLPLGSRTTPAVLEIVRDRSVALEVRQRTIPLLTQLLVAPAGGKTSGYLDGATDALSELGKPGATALLDGLKSPNARVSNSCAFRLNNVDARDPRLVPALLALMDTGGENHIHDAVWLLAERHGSDPRVITRFRRLVEKKSPVLADAATERWVFDVLGNAQDQAAVSYLLSRLPMKPGDIMHGDPIGPLEKYPNDPRVIAAFEQMVINQGIDHVRVAQTLARMGKPGLDALTRLSRHPNPQVRSVANSALNYSRTPRP